MRQKSNDRRHDDKGKEETKTSQMSSGVTAERAAKSECVLWGQIGQVPGMHQSVSFVLAFLYNSAKRFFLVVRRVAVSQSNEVMSTTMLSEKKSNISDFFLVRLLRWRVRIAKSCKEEMKGKRA